MSDDTLPGIAPADAGSPIAVATIREAAERIERGDYPPDTDPTRALAGMIRSLALQVERLSGQAPPPDAPLSHAPPE
jgi:hypothetical protein